MDLLYRQLWWGSAPPQTAKPYHLTERVLAVVYGACSSQNQWGRRHPPPVGWPPGGPWYTALPGLAAGTYCPGKCTHAG